jgi:hypothetical protein
LHSELPHNDPAIELPARACSTDMQKRLASCMIRASPSDLPLSRLMEPARSSEVCAPTEGELSSRLSDNDPPSRRVSEYRRSVGMIAAEPAAKNDNS